MHAGKIPGHASDKLTGSICDEYELELLQLSQDLVRQRRFLWFDYMDDVEKFWAAADVAVLASAGPEAFGLVILEAMACGLPVVATRSGGPAVVVTPDVGILVPMADADALAEAIEALLGDPARRAALGANGRRRVEDQYSPAAFAEVIMTEFDAQAGAEGRM
jgi:glycosyltransferase involved in cell wall biosynthesis